MFFHGGKIKMHFRKNKNAKILQVINWVG